MEPITLHSKEVEEVKHRSRRDQLFSTLFLLVLLVAVPFFASDKGAENLLAWENRTLKISTPDEQVYTIPYDEITSLELIELPDFGACLSGNSSKTLYYGIWENKALGKYVLCTYKSFDVVIQVNTDDQVYWIGYESPETTRLLFQNFLEDLNQSAAGN